MAAFVPLVTIRSSWQGMFAAKLARCEQTNSALLMLEAKTMASYQIRSCYDLTHSPYLSDELCQCNWRSYQRDAVKAHKMREILLQHQLCCNITGPLSICTNDTNSRDRSKRAQPRTKAPYQNSNGIQITISFSPKETNWLDWLYFTSWQDKFQKW